MYYMCRTLPQLAPLQLPALNGYLHAQGLCQKGRPWSIGTPHA